MCQGRTVIIMKFLLYIYIFLMLDFSRCLIYSSCSKDTVSISVAVVSRQHAAVALSGVGPGSTRNGIGLHAQPISTAGFE